MHDEHKDHTGRREIPKQRTERGGGGVQRVFTIADGSEKGKGPRRTDVRGVGAGDSEASVCLNGLSVHWHIQLSALGDDPTDSPP